MSIMGNSQHTQKVKHYMHDHICLFQYKSLYFN